MGASGEIGLATSTTLAEAGWSLYLHYSSNENRITELVFTLQTTYPEQEFIPVQADLLDAASIERLASSLFSVQSVIFAQGQSLYKSLEETTADEIRSLFLVHVEHPMLLIAKLSQKLRKQEHSSIIFVGSIWGETGASYEVAYSAAKGAQHAFVKAYAKETALENTTVNVVAPGFIDTKMNAHIDEESRQLLLEEIPAGKFGAPQDVADMIAFLVSEKASYITGQIIRVNGGWYI